MSESFAQLFEESLQELDLRKGALVVATIVDIKSDYILVNAGLKSDAVIPKTEFGREEVSIGDQIDVVIETVENGFGETRLSREKAIRARVWKELEKAHEDNAVVIGRIIERVKGGFTVNLDTVRAFLPGSLVDIKPTRDPSYLEGKDLEFKIIKMDQKRNNVVVSRRAVMEAETSAERTARLDELQEGQEVMGIVKNITDYGAFIDLGGVDGLLHITDMAWKRVKHPSEVLTIGDEIRVKILKFDRDKNRVSLGIKQLGDDPWRDIARRYPSGTRIVGHVTNITDYGCFVELEEGVEGLVHMSEMDWTNKNIHPSKVVQPGAETEVIVLDIDEDRRRISLGIKQCQSNPWEDFAEKHDKGEKVGGKIRSITDFGVFIGLPGNIDGLVHLSDLSWTENGEDAVRKFKKGDEVEALILGIDAERERISLGIRQLEEDPLAEYTAKQENGDVLSVKVVTVEPKVATVDVAEGVSGILKIADYSYDRIKELSEVISVGDEVDVKIINIDRKTGQIQVSHKAMEDAPEKGKASRTVGDQPTKTTLGDLLKEQMKGKDED